MLLYHWIFNSDIDIDSSVVRIGFTDIYTAAISMLFEVVEQGCCAATFLSNTVSHRLRIP